MVSAESLKPVLGIYYSSGSEVQSLEDCYAYVEDYMRKIQERIGGLVFGNTYGYQYMIAVDCSESSTEAIFALQQIPETDPDHACLMTVEEAKEALKYG